MLITVLLLLVSLVMAYRVPRSAPFVLLFGVVVLLPGGRYSSEIPVLLGVVAGTGLRRLQSGGLKALLPTNWRSAIPLLALSTVALVSWVSNVSAYEGATAVNLTVGTRWFVIRLVLLALMITWERWQFGDLVLPLVTAIGILTVVRVGQALGLPVADDVASTLALLSDAQNVGALNLFAGILVLVIPAVMVKGSEASGVSAWGWRVAGLVFVWALAATGSRTGAIALVVQGTLALVLVRSWRQRAWVGALLAFFLVLGVGAGYLTSKPVFQQVAGYLHGGVSAISDPSDTTPSSPQAPSNQPAEAGQPSPSTAQETQWRGLLWSPRVAIRQAISLERVPKKAVLYLGARRGFESNVSGLEVLLDGSLITTVPQESIPENTMGWIEVPLDPALLAGKRSVQVAIRLAGPGDMVRNYVEIGGLSGTAEGYLSTFFNGQKEFASDLSPDPGRQVGLYQLLLGEKQPQNLVALPSDQGEEALSTSLNDRLMLWQAALSNFQEHPFLGSGLYTYRTVYRRHLTQPIFQDYANTHNMYLQMLSDFGLLGAFVLAWIILWPLLQLLKHGWHGSAAVAWVPGLSAVSVALTSTMHTWVADVRYCLPALLVLSLAGVSYRTTDSPSQKAGSDARSA